MIVTELLARFGIQQDKASFDKADKSLQGLVNGAKKFAGVFAGAFAIHQVAHFIEGLIEVGEELNDTAIKLGITSAALQEFRFAADQVGVSSGALESGFKFLSKSAFDAASGGKESLKVYQRLGINFKDSNGEVKKTEDLFSEAAAAISKVDNNTERAALAQKVFGRGAIELIPLLAQGSEGLSKLREEARALGGGFDEEFVKGADELGDKLAKLKFAGLGLKNILGNALFPILDRGVTKLIDWGKGLLQILKGSKFVEIALLGLASVSLIAGARAIIPWLPFIITFLAVAAAVTAVIALIDDVYNLLTGGKSLIGQWLDEWLGIGTVDLLVKDWSLGLETLINTVMELGSALMDTGKAIGMFFSGDFKGAADLAANLVQREAARAKGVFDSLAAAAGGVPNVPRTAGRGMNAALAGDSSIPRTAGRGINAPLAPGSPGFGQASQESVHPLLRQETASFMGAGEASSAASNAVNQSNHVEVTVNAKTDANPEEIARIAKKHVQEGLAGQARNVRAAGVNRPRE